ncbi:MAG: YtxH domain-containing protein [Chloroflexi bacterium]|nr:YtxH domain-containing protein [Chloroflexota bacterium]
MDDKDSVGGLVLGLMVGAAIGVVVGLLCAPRPGKETRQMLKERAEEARNGVSGVIRKAQDFAAEAKQKAQARLDELRGQDMA